MYDRVFYCAACGREFIRIMFGKKPLILKPITVTCHVCGGVVVTIDNTTRNQTDGSEI